MCQLLGLNANTPTDLVFSFTGFAQRAEEHRDGFGIGFFEGPGARLFVDPASARVSPVAEMVRRYPIHSRHIIAHIRKATQGRVALENTHPFMRELWGRYWVFAHNGNLVDFQPKLHAAFKPVGDTDSERAFCWLLQELAKNHASLPSICHLTESLAELAAWPARHGTFNFLLSNGEGLWAHCSTQLHYVERGHPFASAQLQDEDMTMDFSKHTTVNDRVAVVVTQPLTVNETWHAMMPGELAVFVDGRRLDGAA
jgi:predicted glutamine amidotransferase